MSTCNVCGHLKMAHTHGGICHASGCLCTGPHPKGT